MAVKEAVFVKSSTNLEQCPTPNLPEYAFIGRSNVGKSSLINALTGVKGLAKTSGKPGKTQTINHFLVDQSWYLADLPGYGYAVVSKKSRNEWERMIRGFLAGRENLMAIVVLIDVRLSPQANDIEFLKWLGQKGLPFVIVFTKADKLKPVEIQKNISTFEEEILNHWESMPQTFTTSAEKGQGIDELRAFILDVNERW
jgi:GTP-binding protein